MIFRVTRDVVRLSVRSLGGPLCLGTVKTGRVSLGLCNLPSEFCLVSFFDARGKKTRQTLWWGKEQSQLRPLYAGPSERRADELGCSSGESRRCRSIRLYLRSQEAASPRARRIWPLRKTIQHIKAVYVTSYSSLWHASHIGIISPSPDIFVNKISCFHRFSIELENFLIFFTSR